VELINRVERVPATPSFKVYSRPPIHMWRIL
jgi:hypothetical protein